MDDDTHTVRTREGTWPREILVTMRAPGYVRLHLPPLLYAPALASKLEKALMMLRGVRRVRVARDRARLAVEYDRWITDDRPILTAIDELATPLLEKMELEAFARSLAEQQEARRQELVERGTRIGYLGLLGWVHYWVLRAAIRDPIRFWWVWALVGFGIYTHRRQLKVIKLLPG